MTFCVCFSSPATARGIFDLWELHRVYTVFSKLLGSPKNPSPQDQYGNGFYTEWFSFEPSAPEKVIDLSPDSINAKYREAFVEEYRVLDEGISMPASILTKRITPAIIPSPKDGPKSPYVISIWEVIAS